jgi:hypothetical protein
MKQELESIKIKLGSMLMNTTTDQHGSLNRRLSNAIYEIHFAIKIADELELNQLIETRPSSALAFMK